MTQDEALRLGSGAQNILDTEAFTEAVKMAKEKHYSAWVAALTIDAREKAWADHHAIDGIVDQLKVLTGRAATAKHELSRAAARDA